MPFIPTPNGVEIVVKGTQNSVPVVNVYHVESETPGDEAALTAIMGVFSSWMTETMLEALSAQYYLNEITVTDISVEDGVQVSTTFTTGNQGANVGAAMAANGAMCVSWRTAKTGRSYRGRTFLGGLANSYLDNAVTFSTAATTFIAGAAADLMGLLNELDVKLCVLSKVLNKVARVAGVLTEITGIIVDSKVDSQRRRTAN